MAKTQDPAGQGGALAVDVVTDTREHATTRASSERTVLRESDENYRVVIVHLADR